MLIRIIYKVTLLAVLCLGGMACTDDVASLLPAGEDGRLRIVYRTASSSTTRVTEPGWDEPWNENLVTRLDLFVFNANADTTLFLHIPFPDMDNAVTADDYRELETVQLTYENATADKTYYLVANCGQLADATIANLDDLRSVMIDTPIDIDGYQLSFVMDAKGSLTTGMEDGAPLTTLSFDLSRAAVKIRLFVQDKDERSITNQCTFRLMNYVAAGTSVLAEAERYGAGTGQTHESMEQATAPALTYGQQAVFYSYPNDWFDESKWENIVQEDPIYADRQTHVVLFAPYGEEGFFYYKVPVNKALPENLDDVELDAADYRHLYRMQRNYIYDITVTIDRKGGTVGEPVEPKLYYQVLPFDEEEIEIPAFE